MDTLSLGETRLSQEDIVEFRIETSQDMHARTQSSINSPIINTNASTNGMEYNMKPKYIVANSYGAHVYTDPLSRYLIKMATSLTPVQADPCVKYEVDLYMGEDDTRYTTEIERTWTSQATRFLLDKLQERNQWEHKQSQVCHKPIFQYHLVLKRKLMIGVS